MNLSPTLRAFILLSITAFCWACNSVFAKLAVGEVSPLLLTSLRWFGALTLMVVFAHKKIARDWKFLRQHIISLIFMGALGFTTFNAFFYHAAYTTTALNIGIIQGSVPVFVLVGAFAFFGTRVGPFQTLGAFITIVGVCIVASSGEFARLAKLSVNQGDYFMVIACFLYAGYALALRKFSGASSLSIFAVMAASAFVTSVPITATEYFLGNYQWPTTTGWIIVALVTLLPSFVAQICFIQGVGLIGPGRAGIFVNLVPIFASILAVLVLSEPFHLYHGIALAFVVGGIWVSERIKLNSHSDLVV